MRMTLLSNKHWKKCGCLFSIFKKSRKPVTRDLLTRFGSGFQKPKRLSGYRILLQYTLFEIRFMAATCNLAQSMLYTDCFTPHDSSHDLSVICLHPLMRHPLIFDRSVCFVCPLAGLFLSATNTLRSSLSICSLLSTFKPAS